MNPHSLGTYTKDNYQFVNLHFELVAFIVIQNVVQLSMRNFVPDLMKLDEIIEPSNLSQELMVVRLGHLLLLVLFILNVLPHGPL